MISLENTLYDALNFYGLLDVAQLVTFQPIFPSITVHSCLRMQTAQLSWLVDVSVWNNLDDVLYQAWQTASDQIVGYRSYWLRNNPSSLAVSPGFQIFKFWINLVLSVISNLGGRLIPRGGPVGWMVIVSRVLEYSTSNTSWPYCTFGVWHSSPPHWEKLWWLGPGWMKCRTTVGYETTASFVEIMSFIAWRTRPPWAMNSGDFVRHNLW